MSYIKQFYQAAKSGDFNAMKEAAIKDKNVKNVVDVSLVEAATYNHLEVVKYLVEGKGLNKHADINCLDGRPFDWACLHNNWDVANYLVEKGVNTSKNDYYAYRIMVINKISTDNVLFQSLFTQLKDKLSSNPSLREYFLTFSLEEDNVPLFNDLVSYMNKPKLSSVFALLIKKYQKSTNILSYLLDKDNSLVDTNLLLVAIQSKNLEMVKLLIKAGADIHEGGELTEISYRGNLFITVRNPITGIMEPDDSNKITNVIKYTENAAFQTACLYSLDIAFYLLEQEKLLPLTANPFNKEGLIPLASSEGNYEILQKIEEDGVDLAKHVDNIIHYFSIHNNILISEDDYDYHYDTNRKNLQDMYAKSRLHFMNMLKFIVKIGGNFNNNINLLHCTLNYDFAEGRDYIINHGGNVANFLNYYDNYKGCTCDGDFEISKENHDWCRQYVNKHQ